MPLCRLTSVALCCLVLLGFVSHVVALAVAFCSFVGVLALRSVILQKQKIVLSSFSVLRFAVVCCFCSALFCLASLRLALLGIASFRVALLRCACLALTPRDTTVFFGQRPKHDPGIIKPRFCSNKTTKWQAEKHEEDTKIRKLAVYRKHRTRNTGADSVTFLPYPFML